MFNLNFSKIIDSTDCKNLNDEKACLIGLSLIKDLGSVSLKKLLKYFGSPKKIWEADKKQLKKVKGIGTKRADNIVKGRKKIKPFKEIEKADNKDINIITFIENNYPVLLRHIHDPPFVLYYRGSLDVRDLFSAAIVGTRRASRYAIKTSGQFSRNLSALGLTVVSGLARGVDTAAHRAALDSGGRTIAVLGSGVDILYPPENKKLAFSISKQGAVISEYSLGTKPEGSNFPARNRIISGLSLGTLVVEAPKRSGSLITAHQALEQGRDVFAVPGRIDHPNSSGSNHLLREGAVCALNAEQIKDDLKVERYYSFVPLSEREKMTEDVKCNRFKAEEINIPRAERLVLSIIEDQSRTHIDDIIRKMDEYNASEINELLTRLELRGLIKQMPGKYYNRR